MAQLIHVNHGEAIMPIYIRFEFSVNALLNNTDKLAKQLHYINKTNTIQTLQVV